MRIKIAGLLAIGLITAIAGYLYLDNRSSSDIHLSKLSFSERPINKLMENRAVAVVDAREYPWSALGRLNVGGTHFCNATIVGPDLALTRASCLFNQAESKWYSSQDMTYVGAYQRDNSDLNAKVVEFEIGKGYNPQDKSLTSLFRNWALIRLTSQLGQKTGWLGVTRKADDGNSLSLPVGYRRGWQHALSTFPFCLNGAAKELCPDVTIDGSLTQVILSPKTVNVLVAGDTDEVFSAWSLPTRGQAPSQQLDNIRLVPLDTISRLLKEQGYLLENQITQEILKAALEKAEENGALEQSDRIGTGALYRLFDALNRKALSADPAS
ncbi:trypsin-like serine peptidase [Kiloniella laminariae]|uniref:trypsin-like serine peptidase n=1 Tax=Kiloniella laminariae TaxID=454162 RepID=UPI00035E85D7|nr:trypsin-like serine protease [Kiloniella laminariae]